MHIWPSVVLREVLMGNLCYLEAPQPVQSWVRLSIHEGACEICHIDSKELREKALQRVPESLRDMMRVEVARIWPEQRAKVLRARGL